MSERKKALFVHYNPDSSGSFVEKVVAQFNYFSKDYDIEFMLPDDGRFTEVVQGFGVVCHKRGMHENEGVFSYLKNLVSFAVFLKRRKIDFIYFLDFVWWKPAEILAASLLEIPMLTFTGFYKTEESLKGFLGKMDLIVANSHKTAEMYLENGLENRVRVIHNFIDTDRYASAESCRDELDFGDSKLIGYVGVLHPIKGIEFLLDAMPAILKIHPNTELALVGKEKESGFKALLEQKVKDMSLERHVHFLGHRSDIPELMKAFDMLVVPSLDEPFGYINIEAGAASTSVIASNVGGIPEIIKHEQTGLLVPPRDSEAIAEACIRLLSDSQLRKRLGEAGAQRVEEHFSVKNGLSRWSSVFSELEAMC